MDWESDLELLCKGDRMNVMFDDGFIVHGALTFDRISRQLTV